MQLIENKDCFEFLNSIQSETIDLVLTDPPYEISKESGFAQSKETGTDIDRFRISIDFGEWDKVSLGLDNLIQEFYRVLKPSGTLICFYDLWKITILKEHFEKANFKQLRFIEWVKLNPVPINSKLNYLTNSREIALTGVKEGKPIFNSEYDNGIYYYPIYHDNNRFHPTQKPIELFSELIKKHSKENDTVLDCFSGSGTTAISCSLTNRNFVGCEISKEYYEKSLERLHNFSGISKNIDDF